MTVRARRRDRPPSSRRSTCIAVVGERDASPELVALAEEVGAWIAARGAILVCGGMGGVMEAASKGCALAGGLVVGILPTDDAADANPYVSVRVATGMGEGRNIIVVRSAQAVIAIGGSYGTLSEIAFALRLNVPVIALRSWVFSRERAEADPLVRVADAKTAVAKALELAIRG
jgi:uncharacterized protein (TIGR00725 family)